MNLAKLFVIFGILLIATLGQTEGRRRWFKRKYKTIGCAGRGKLNSIVGQTGNDQQSSIAGNEIEVPHNGTQRNNRRPNNSRKSKCGGNRCVDRVLTIEINNNSTDSGITINNNKLSRRSRNRQHKCSGSRKWRFNKIARVAGSNTTLSDVPLLHTTEVQSRRRNGNRKRNCSARRARKGKCQRPETHDNEPNGEESSDVGSSIENELQIDVQSPIMATEPKENIL